MMIIATTFYKVLVLDIDLFESQIVDERHFSSKEEAEDYCRHIKEYSNYTTFIVTM